VRASATTLRVALAPAHDNGTRYPASWHRWCVRRPRSVDLSACPGDHPGTRIALLRTFVLCVTVLVRTADKDVSVAEVMISIGNFSGLHAAAARITTQSALNPLLWMCALTTLPAWAISCFVLGWFQTAFFLAGSIAPVCTAVAFFYLLFVDPDRLQSEKFQLTRHQYRLLGDDRISSDRLGQIIEGTREQVSNPTPEPGKVQEAESRG
jgi:hypothetical protein